MFAQEAVDELVDTMTEPKFAAMDGVQNAPRTSFNISAASKAAPTITKDKVPEKDIAAPNPVCCALLEIPLHTTAVL